MRVSSDPTGVAVVVPGHLRGLLEALSEWEAVGWVEGAGCMLVPRSAPSPAVHWRQVVAVAALDSVVAWAGAVLEAEKHAVCPVHSLAR